jgi:outer membrane protein assembly factor BamB
MLRRVVRVLVLPLSALAVLAVAGCGTASPPAPAAAGRPTAPLASRSAGPQPAAASVAPVASTGCQTGAWAYDITAAGQLAWRVTLPGSAGYTGAQPVVAGGVAVFAQDNAIAGIRVSDGRLLWQRVFPNSGDFSPGTVYHLWTWHGAVIAQVGQVSPDGRVLSLNPDTGAVRWTLKTGELLGTQAVTSNGVLAMQKSNGIIEGADLSTGKLLWSRRFGTSDGPAAAGTVVVATKGGVVAGFNGRTGAELWSADGMPNQPTVTVRAATQVLVADLDPYAEPLPRLYPVTGLSAATGRPQWALTTAAPVTGVWAGSAGVVVTTAASTGHQPELLLLNPATGQVRWRVSAYAAAETAPLISASDVVYAVSTPASAKSHPGLNQIVDRSLATGKVRWSMITAADFLAQPSGSDLLLVASDTSALKVLTVDRATGKVKATVTLPAMVSVAPVVTAGSTLVQSAFPPCATAFAGAADAAGS